MNTSYWWHLNSSTISKIVLLLLTSTNHSKHYLLVMPSDDINVLDQYEYIGRMLD